MIFSFVQITHGQSTGVVNGACGGYDACSAGGPASGFQTSQGTTYTGTWSCAGQNGGTSASCSGNQSQFSTSAQSYSWGCSGSTAECIESGSGIVSNSAYCAGTAPSCTTPSTGTTSNGTGTGTTSSGSTGSSLCITAPTPATGTYNETFYAQMENACQQVFGQDQSSCVASGQGFCTYKNQALAYNCGMANSGGGIGYCFPGQTPAANGCINAMTPTQLKAALGNVSCPASAGIGGANTGAFTPGVCVLISSLTPAQKLQSESVNMVCPTGYLPAPGLAAGTSTGGSGMQNANTGGAGMTSFTATLNSGFGAISTEHQNFYAAGPAGSAGTTSGSINSCSASTALSTLSSLIPILQSASGVLSAGNVSPSILAGVENLISTIAKTLPGLNTCIAGSAGSM